jgi:Ca2+/Na+ antiporter
MSNVRARWLHGKCELGERGGAVKEWVVLTGGGVLLYLGAEWFVGGASALALVLRVPRSWWD